MSSPGSETRRFMTVRHEQVMFYGSCEALIEQKQREKRSVIYQKVRTNKIIICQSVHLF